MPVRMNMVLDAAEDEDKVMVSAAPPDDQDGLANVTTRVDAAPVKEGGIQLALASAITHADVTPIKEAGIQLAPTVPGSKTLDAKDVAVMKDVIADKATDKEATARAHREATAVAEVDVKISFLHKG
ncbi:hypothetical protein RE628_15685 [Paenibacillus sp. D2_2]|uniref:hypothetical protein n=1 Tax=Paenibacillus sp. D2_2 TaxID=3073092 RepID=UPI00281602BE|nr:hypothetical protein [Paenibacillus sp. D2_2]WMT38967.1 hypothetical protein RE628_15685 [Paenibacillus sp. D2_2]